MQDGRWIVSAGERLGVSTPINRALLTLLCAISDDDEQQDLHASAHAVLALDQDLAS